MGHGTCFLKQVATYGALVRVFGVELATRESYFLVKLRSIRMVNLRTTDIAMTGAGDRV
jgi:hypothetical protein